MLTDNERGMTYRLNNDMTYNDMTDRNLVFYNHMSKPGHPQAWAGASAPWKCCNVFCTLAVAVDQLFMHYFHNFSSVPRSIDGRGRFGGSVLFI